MKSSFSPLFICCSVVLAIISGSCDQKKASINSNLAATRSIQTLPLIGPDRLVYSLANLLGGKELSASNPFFEIARTESYAEYRKELDTMWQQSLRQRLSPMTNWSEKELQEIHQQKHTLFYPFGGPDFLYAHTFFPKADNYILFGLEPVGFPPDLRQYSGSALDTLLDHLLNSIRNSVGRSFFITLKMCSDLNRRDIRGVVPFLLLYASKTGHAVVKARPFTLDTSGTIVYADSFQQLDKPNPNRGVHIELINEDGSKHQLYYIQFNAADEEIAANPGIQKFFAAMSGKITTMLKAASYLLHNDAFAKIRNIILNRSDYIFQDDSGMPFRFLNDGQWNNRLYGRFCKPIDSFSWINQPDLEKAFEASNAKDFPFMYGYGYGKMLIFAKKAAKQ